MFSQHRSIIPRSGCWVGKIWDPENWNGDIQMGVSEYITSAGCLPPPKSLRLSVCPNLPRSDKRRHFYHAKRCCGDISRAVLPSVAVLTSSLSDNQGLVPGITWMGTWWEWLKRKETMHQKSCKNLHVQAGARGIHLGLYFESAS